MTARLYLTVYAKDNLPTETAHVVSKSLGTVDEALSDLQFRDELHGTGGIVARINRHHPQAALFVEDRYVLAHSDFGVIGGAFLREGTIDLSSDDGPGGEFMVWTGPGPMAILSNAVMDYDSNIFGGHNPIDGYWDLSAQGSLAGNDNGHPIPMLKRALVEAQLQTPNAISVVDHSSWSYALDSAAAVPPTWTGSYGVNVGDDLLTIVGQFDQLGGVFFRMSHFFKLDAYLSYGTAKSGAFGAGTVRFEKGVNVAAAIDRKVRGSVHVTHLIVGGADRTFTTAVDPGYVSPQVIRYGFLSVPETSDTSSLQEAGLAHIAARKRQTDAWTFPLHDHGNTPASGIYEPGNHYKVGDTVSLHTGTGEYDANEQAAPVAAVEWRLKTGREANGDYWVIPEIGSTFHWGGAGSFQGRDAPGSQHRFLFCQPGTLGSPDTVRWDYPVGAAFGSGYYRHHGDAVATTGPVLIGPEAYGWLTLTNGRARTPQNASPQDVQLGVWGYYTEGAGVAWPGNYLSTPVGVGRVRVKGEVAHPSIVTGGEVGNRTLYLIFGRHTSTGGLIQTWHALATVADGATASFDLTFDAVADAHLIMLQSETDGGGNHGIDILSFAMAWAPSGTPVLPGTGLTSVNDGHPDLIGTGSRAKRCSDTEHYHTDRDPTSADDWASGGWRHNTLWINETTGAMFLLTDADAGTWLPVGGGGAPTNATYLTTTAHADLSAEVVVGATPGGELGGTWATPTVDTSHGGGTHAAAQAAAEATAAAALSGHAVAADPHTGYQKESEKAAASGYASLDGSTKVPIAQIPTGSTSSTVSLGDHAHTSGGRYELLVSDTPAGSPLVFADLLQNEAGTDLLYTDSPVSP